MPAAPSSPQQPLPPRPSIAIVGAGALGGYYGARLASADHDVRFLLRSDYAAVRSRGLTVESCHGDFDLPRVQAFRTTAEIGPCDLVIVALKTTANSELPNLVEPLLHPGTTLFTLQNGLGNDELLARHFGPGRVLGGLCFVCINRIAAGHIHHSAEGLIRFGEFSGPPGPRAESIARLLESADIPCRIEPSLAAAQWRKLVWNIPFNGLAIAAGGLDTSALLAHPSMETLVRDLMSEVAAASAAQGHPLPPSVIDEQIDRTRAMDNYRPSSLVDWQAGKPVEVDSIWGEPLRRAQATGLDSPRLSMLHLLLTALTGDS